MNDLQVFWKCIILEVYVEGKYVDRHHMQKPTTTIQWTVEMPPAFQQ